MKILNLYAGIGGNRKLWEDVKVTAIEIKPDIAELYKRLFPDDIIIISDAHKYLLEHYEDFDFIWSSPPCPTHSRMRFNHKEKVYPDMNLYQEIIFLENHFKKGKWVVENVVGYYEPLKKPTIEIQRHYFWSNFNIGKMKIQKDNVCKITKEKLSEVKDIDISKWDIKDKRKLLRNAVNPKLGLHILNEAFKIKQKTLNNEGG